MQRLIDPPAHFSPLSEWEEFLRAMEKSLAENPGDPDYAFHVALAKHEIAAREASPAPLEHA